MLKKQGCSLVVFWSKLKEKHEEWLLFLCYGKV